MEHADKITREEHEKRILRISFVMSCVLLVAEIAAAIIFRSHAVFMDAMAAILLSRLERFYIVCQRCLNFDSRHDRKSSLKSSLTMHFEAYESPLKALLRQKKKH